MHAIHVLKCSGMFKRKVWNQCLMFLTETDGIRVGCNVHIRFFSKKELWEGGSGPGVRGVTDTCPLGIREREEITA